VEWWQVLTAITFTNGWHPEAINAIVPQGWSVAIEMNFYLLLPFFVLLITSLRAAVAATFVTFAGGVGISWLLYQQLLPHYLPEQAYIVGAFAGGFWLPIQLAVFCLGFVFYHLFKRTLKVTDPRTRRTDGRRYLLAALCAMAIWVKVNYLFVPAHFLYGLAFVSLAYSLALHPTRWLVNPLSTYFGKISYSMYLVHEMILSMLSEMFPAFGATWPKDIAFGTGFLLTVALSAGVGTLTFKGVEIPGQRLGRRCTIWLDSISRDSLRLPFLKNT